MNDTETKQILLFTKVGLANKICFLSIVTLLMMTSKTSKDAATFGIKKTSNESCFQGIETSSLREHNILIMDNTGLVRYCIQGNISPILFLSYRSRSL